RSRRHTRCLSDWSSDVCSSDLDVHAAIRRCLLPNGEISDDASTALRRIRSSIAETREAIQKTLKQILRARHAEAGEDYVTLRNRSEERRVGKECRYQMSGEEYR